MDEKKITVGKAYMLQGRQWYGAQIGPWDYMRFFGPCIAYAIGEMVAVYPELLNGHVIKVRPSYPDPPAGYIAEAPDLGLKLVLADTEPTVCGLLVLQYADRFGLEIVTVDQLPPKKESDYHGSWHSDGPCSCH